MKVALSIAGSDSSAGAGVQADLKTFSALGVYGCTAITAITAQNTRRVAEVFKLPAGIVRAQVKAVVSDSPPDAIKVGMVYGQEIIVTLETILAKMKVPIVVDPILAAGTGYSLMQDDAWEPFVKKLIPRSTVVTPNRREAEELSGIKITDYKDAIKAARKIRRLGARNVIVKGGHTEGTMVTDILLERSGKVTRISNPRITVKETHGSGCNFSAALTAYIARGFAISEACIKANKYVNRALKDTVIVGSGLHVTNPLSRVYRDAERYSTLVDLQAAVDRLVTMQDFGRLIPETHTNFAFALPDAAGRDDVAAVKGRIAKVGKAAIAVSRVEFGASRHMADAVLACMKVRPSTRCVMNIRYDRALIGICKSLFSVSSYNRNREPPKTRHREGSSISWGTGRALSKNPLAEIVYHTGTVGKEPMITVFGSDPTDVLGKIEKILRLSR